MDESLLIQFEALNGRLIEHRKAVRERDRILSLMATLDAQLVQKRDELAALMTQLQAEQADVAALEGLSVSAVFSKLFGDYPEKLEQEVAQYLEAKTAVETCRITIDSLENNLHELDEQLVALADCDEELAQAEAAQVAFLQAHGLIDSEPLITLTKEIADRKALMREIEEALIIGGQVVGQVAEIIRFITPDDLVPSWLRNLSTVPPTYTGMGRVVLKASRIQPELDLFQAELEDISSPLIPYPDLQIPGYNEVMDDRANYRNVSGKIRAWQRHGRINIWRDHLIKLHRQLEQKAAVLQGKKQHANEEVARRQTELSTWIASVWQADDFETP